MPNIIAVIWDFDKTLVDGYMQDPIFKEYGVDAESFWAEVNAACQSRHHLPQPLYPLCEVRDLSGAKQQKTI